MVWHISPVKLSPFWWLRSSYAYSLLQSDNFNISKISTSRKVMEDIISLPKIRWWWKQSSKYASISWREHWFYDIGIIFYGRKYLCYCEEAFQLPSGFTIYKSLFWNPDGSRGVTGGPHQIFNNSGKYDQFKVNSQFQFFSNQYRLYRKWYQVNPDVSILDFKDSMFCDVINKDRIWLKLIQSDASRSLKK